MLLLRFKTKLVMGKTQFTLTDESLMYFGTHKGEMLANLPDHYCKWLLLQSWIKSHTALYAYLIENEELLK